MAGEGFGGSVSAFLPLRPGRRRGQAGSWLIRPLRPIVINAEAKRQPVYGPAALSDPLCAPFAR